MAFRISAEDENASKDDMSFVVDRLVAFNRSRAPDPDRSYVRLFLRDGEGAIHGGLLGEIYFGWLFVAILWVDEARRGEGHGTALLRQAEEAALGRGCHAVWLDTFSFQAPKFYAAQGYREFGRLEDYPPGISRHFLWKPLAPAG